MEATMTAHVLVAYATKRGSTHEVADTIAATLLEQGLDVDVRPAASVADITAYNSVVLGGALYTGRWHREARQFLARHRKALVRIPIAVFAMGPRTLEEADVNASREQLERALARVREVKPIATAVFGGVVDPTKLGFPFNRMPASDARDWQAIHEWAAALAPAREAAAVSP
jgi:menaquinone-dependent protoporphyrinogen oxidase